MSCCRLHVSWDKEKPPQTLRIEKWLGPVSDACIWLYMYIIYIYYIYIYIWYAYVYVHIRLYIIYIYIYIYHCIYDNHTHIYIYTSIHMHTFHRHIWSYMYNIYMEHTSHTQLYYLFQVIQWNMDCLWKTSMNRGIQWAKGSIFVYFRCGSYASILDFHGINLCITPAVGHSANWLLQESQRAILTYLQFVGVHGHYLVVFDMQRNM